MKIEKMKELRELNTMKISSISEYYAKIFNLDDLLEVLDFAKGRKLSKLFIGNGSNIIFSKDFYKNSIVIDLKGVNFINLKENYIECGCGVLGKDFLNFCVKNNISNFEFLAGIPGTIGGFVKMNAGAFGYEISEFINSIKFVDIENMKVIEKFNNELNFSYRKLSNVKNKIILSVKFSYKRAAALNIKEKILNFLNKRKIKQPVRFNCGSVFKNGDNYFAGELIEKAGLKGFVLGKAKISDKHANFIINLGNAKGENILNLIKFVEKKVEDKFSIKLEREVVVF